MLRSLSKSVVSLSRAHYRGFSSLSDAVLVRDYIKDALYNSQEGYNRNKKCGILEEPIDFGSLWGKWEFNKTIQTVYKNQGVNYMNAVELFSPYFSQAIAAHILKQHKLGTPLTIMELSSGSSTNMKNILTHMKTKMPNVFKNVRYYLLTDDVYFKKVDIPEEFANKITIQSIKNAEDCKWMCDNCFVIMNDIMSCLPHDKVRIPLGTKGSSINEYQQCVVVPNGSAYDEVYMPVSDPLIKQYLEILLNNEYSMMTLAEHQNHSIDSYNKHSALGNTRGERFKKFIPTEAFIPTELLRIMQTIMKMTTNCHFVGYDFDYLPPCAEGDLDSPINCINGPIVCSYDDKGKCTDEKSYLLHKYKTDIFFSTDFITLAMVIKSLTKNDSKIVKLNNFMTENIKVVNTRTMLGWNPLTKDFKNLLSYVSPHSLFNIVYGEIVTLKKLSINHESWEEEIAKMDPIKQISIIVNQ